VTIKYFKRSNLVGKISNQLVGPTVSDSKSPAHNLLDRFSSLFIDDSSIDRAFQRLNSVMACSISPAPLLVLAPPPTFSFLCRTTAEASSATAELHLAPASCYSDHSQHKPRMPPCSTTSSEAPRAFQSSLPSFQCTPADARRPPLPWLVASRAPASFPAGQPINLGRLGSLMLPMRSPDATTPPSTSPTAVRRRMPPTPDLLLLRASFRPTKATNGSVVAR
jgi:hypothetical protein